MTSRESIEAELADLRDLIAATEEWLAEDEDNWAARISLAGLRSREDRLMAELIAATNRKACGSGTTGVAAVQAGYQFIGCDMEQEYCEIARARIEHATTKREDANRRGHSSPSCATARPSGYACGIQGKLFEE